MEINRREFVRGSVLAALAAGAGCASAKVQAVKQAKGPEAIRAVLFHLGHNMWCDWPTQYMGAGEAALDGLNPKRRPDLKLRCRDDYWRQITDHAIAKGMNMIVIDVGEGVIYPSHRELQIAGTWPVAKMRAEIDRLNAAGIEVIPKLNFSTTHNGWLKDYRHMVSSRPYYRVCEDLLKDTYETFGHPRFIHLGCDEETTEHQGAEWCGCNHIDVRRSEYWWQDFLHLVRTTEDLGARPWVWSDYCWHHADYYERCPKSVVQSNWFYDECYGGFDPEKNKTNEHENVLAFWKLEAAGFDQIPCGTNWVGHVRRAKKVGAEDVIGEIVKLGRKVVAPKRLLGFLMAPWAATDTEEHVAFNNHGVDLFANALGRK